MYTQPSRPAFTLVELLVVIAIIAILASIVIPAVGAMMRRGSEAKTTAILTEIASAITAYETQSGKFPRQDTGFTDSDGNAVDDLAAFYTPDNALSANAALTSVLASIDQDSFGPTGEMSSNLDPEDPDSALVIRDAWDEPIYYQPWTVYLNKDDALKPNSYQLWSFGVNMENDVGDYGIKKEFDPENPLPYGDDITNWN